MERVVALTEDGIKKYLEGCIKFWCESSEDYAVYYVDAFQSVYTSLFGETYSMKEE